MYNDLERNEIAQAVARYWPNVSDAIEALRNLPEFMAYKKLSAMQVGRWFASRRKRDRDFIKLVANYRDAFEKERIDVAIKGERARAERDQAKTEYQRLERDEKILDAIREKLETLIKDTTDPKVINTLYSRVLTVTDRRRENAMPAIPNTWASGQMLEAYNEALRDLLSKEKKTAVVQLAREKYKAKLEKSHGGS